MLSRHFIIRLMVADTKENVAAKALADQLCDLAPPTLGRLGRLIGRIEEGKGKAYASKTDVRCSDRNRIISNRSILIATGGSATAEMAFFPSFASAALAVKNVNPSTPRVHSNPRFHIKDYARRKHPLWLRLRSYLVHCNVK